MILSRATDNTTELARQVYRQKCARVGRSRTINCRLTGSFLSSTEESERRKRNDEEEQWHLLSTTATTVGIHRSNSIEEMIKLAATRTSLALENICVFSSSLSSSTD